LTVAPSPIDYTRNVTLDALCDRLQSSRRALVFSGAGLSTGSGIPDFRGPQGIWRHRQPVYYQEFLQSDAKRLEYWEYKAEGYAAFRDAAPNPAHRAIARLERLQRLEAIVTQNIDGLHQAAGSSPERVVELHGSNRFVECVGCGARAAPEPALAFFHAEHAVPRCACGNWLKFATVSFGQSLRPEVLARALEHVERSDLILVVGSTLSVEPAASLPLRAVARGVPYVIINRGSTQHDGIANLRIDDDVAAVLPAAIDRIELERTPT
jgi:NAD-dependent deacetylase